MQKFQLQITNYILLQKTSAIPKFGLYNTHKIKSKFVKINMYQNNFV